MRWQNGVMEFLFNLYCWMFVGILGNALIAWEWGRKGWLQIGLEGPQNKKVFFALILFIGMLVGALLLKLEPPFNSPKSLCILIWPAFVFIVARYSKPYSQRLYDRAKYLHETTYVGDWHSLRSEEDINQVRGNPRLKEARKLYLQAIEIEERAYQQEHEPPAKRQHLFNVITVYLQLALLYRQQYRLAQSAEYAQKALEKLKEIDDQSQEVLSHTSNALFRLGEIDHIEGRYQEAIEKYQRSLKIDQKLQDKPGIRLTLQMLSELESQERKK
jgi:tetratricopeptide (TPR) repeat protein